MANSDVNWNDIIRTGDSKRNDPIDSVIDAFKSVISTNSDAILGSGWQPSDKNKVVNKTKSAEVASKSAWGESFGTTNNQDENENSWGAWGNGNSWDNNNSWGNNDSSGWGNEDNQSYSTNNINSAYTDDRRNTGTNLYTDSSERYHESTDASEFNNVDDIHTNNINNFSKTRQEYDNQTRGWPQPPQQQQQQQQQQHHSYYEEPQESPPPSESDASTDQNSENVDPDDRESRISAWHNIVDPDAKERDGLGGGQLHRSGRNYIPLAESAVLSIQQKGGSRRGGKKGYEKVIPKTKHFITKVPVKPQKSVAQSTTVVQKAANAAPVKAKVPQNTHNSQNTQPTPPNRTQQQTQQALKKPSPPPSQSSQRQPSSSSQRSQQPQQPQQPQKPQQSQKPQQPQQPQQHQQHQKQQPQQSWTSELVNTPFWETKPSSPSPPPIQHPSPKQYANEMVSNQSIRHRSPVRSPRPTRPALPFIPPEFDSSPYQRQLSPSPVRDKPHRYNGQVMNGWEDNKDYKPNNNVEDQRNEYYEENDVERRENKSGHILGHKEPEREQASHIDRRDRGQLLLTINVELSEGKTQAIEVHVYDNPEDLAKYFCDLWKVTNPVVMPALECLIKEEKEKRLGIN